MPAAARVTIHASQFPAGVRRALVDSLRSRKINPKFHYESFKQVRKWLALHEAFSPSRAEPDCGRVYEQAFETAAASVSAPRVHLVGLGCGGGRKDAALLRRLQAPGRELFYTPVDVGVPMVLEGWGTALAEVPEANCFPLVCDLAWAGDLAGVLEEPRAAGAARIYTFFGMIPNFEPETILPRLAVWIRPGDALLLSANLAPGADYAAGVRRILPQYDNALTRDWLLTFLLDLGVETTDGSIRFCVEDDPAKVAPSRVAAYFDFARPRSLDLGEDRFEFFPGDSLRLFFSYRHTPQRLRALLEPHRLDIRAQWIAASEEEGVFLVGRAA
jgi:uncharacterized SAM-dependent methyltransferase